MIDRSGNQLNKWGLSWKCPSEFQVSKRDVVCSAVSPIATILNWSGNVEQTSHFHQIKVKRIQRFSSTAVSRHSLIHAIHSRCRCRQITKQFSNHKLCECRSGWVIPPICARSWVTGNLFLLSITVFSRRFRIRGYASSWACYYFAPYSQEYESKIFHSNGPFPTFFTRCLPIAFTPHRQVCSCYWTWNYFLTKL